MYHVVDQLEAMRGASVLSALNLTKGCHQVKLAEEPKRSNCIHISKGTFPMEGFANGDENFRSSVPKVIGFDVGKFAAKMCCSIHR